MGFEIFSPVRNELGEGPIYDGKTAELIWFDIVGQVMFIGNTNQGTIRSYGFSEPVSAAFLTNSDILLVAAASGVVAFDRRTGRGLFTIYVAGSVRPCLRKLLFPMRSVFLLMGRQLICVIHQSG
jgi:sugar lactone lactonase YvrE